LGPGEKDKKGEVLEVDRNDLSPMEILTDKRGSTSRRGEESRFTMSRGLMVSGRNAWPTRGEEGRGVSSCLKGRRERPEIMKRGKKGFERKRRLGPPSWAEEKSKIRGKKKKKNTESREWSGKGGKAVAGGKRKQKGARKAPL